MGANTLGSIRRKGKLSFLGDSAPLREAEAVQAGEEFFQGIEPTAAQTGKMRVT